MSDRSVSRRTAVELRPSAVGLALLWTVIIASVLLLEYRETQQAAFDTARAQAVAEISKDNAYRSWIAQQGGVYVPISAKNQPNLYLDQVPERDIFTPAGKPLTLMNAAYVLRQVHELGAAKFGAQGHLTSLHPLRPENRPTAWEARALKRLSAQVPSVTEVETIDGEKILRYMQPLYVDQSCLKCHAAQNYKRGELRGGISISLPMQPVLAMARAQFSHATVVLLCFWLLGLGGILFSLSSIGRRITERERASVALRESEEKHRSLFHNMDQGVVYQDSLGQIIDANPAAERILGLTLEEMRGRKSSDPRWQALDAAGMGLPGEEHPASMALRTGQVVRQRLMSIYNPQDRSQRWIVVGAVPQFRGSPPEAYQVVATFTDVTELKLAEQAYRDSEQRYRSTIDNLGDPLHVVGRDLRLQFINSALLDWHRQLGLSAAIVDQPLQTVYPFLDARVLAEYDQIFDGGEMLVTEETTQLGAVTVITETRKIPVLEDGRVVRIITILRDITQRKQAEQALLASERLLRESQAIGRIGSYDENIIAGTWTSSQALDEIFGIDSAYDRTLLSWAGLIHPDHRQQMVEYIARIQSQRERFDKVYKIIRQSDGQERWVHGLGELEYDGQGAAIRMIGTIQDITERKVAEDALRDSEQFLTRCA